MKAVTTSIFGPVHLKQLGPRSSVFDCWLAELRPEHGEEGLPCLIRRMLPPYAFAPDLMKAFLDRTREIMAFSHPAVLLPITIQNEQGTLYTLSDACTGWNLHELLVDWQDRQISLPLEHVLQLFFPVAHALACAHARPGKPLIHGAIRPVSIWVEADGKPRLADFEVGALAEFELKGSSVFEATGIRALAPERDQDWVSPPAGTDSYSFAATFLEVLAAGRLTKVQNSAVLRDRLTLLMTQGIPPELLRLMASCLADDPQERPAMKDVAEVLKELLSRAPRTQRFSELLAINAPPRHPLTGRADPRALAQSLATASPLVLDAEQASEAAQSKSTLPENTSGGGGLRAILILLLLLILGGLGTHIAAPGLLPGLLPGLFGGGGTPVTVEVETVPQGATISMAGGASLGAAPLRLPMSVGRGGVVQLTASADGFVPETQEQTVTAEGRMSFRFELKPQDPSLGLLSIVTAPAGAQVVVDGRSVGVTPLSLHDLSLDKPHRAVLSLEGFRTERHSVTLKAGKVQELVVQLEPRSVGDSDDEPASAERSSAAAAGPSRAPRETAGLVVHSSLLARLQIDGKDQGTTSPDRVIRLSPGPHRIRLEEATFAEPVELDASLPAGETAIFEYDAGKGTWKMGSRPDPTPPPEPGATP